MPRLSDAGVRKAGTTVGAIWRHSRTDVKVLICKIDWYGDYAYITIRHLDKRYRKGMYEQPISVEAFQAAYTLMKGITEPSLARQDELHLDNDAQAKIVHVGWC